MTFTFDWYRRVDAAAVGWRDITLVSHQPEWVKWFRRLLVVPHTLALPEASATGRCHSGEQLLRDTLYALEGVGIEVVGKGGTGEGWGMGGWWVVVWGCVVGKEGERHEGDFVMLWCSFWLWTRSNCMPFPLLWDTLYALEGIGMEVVGKGGTGEGPSAWPCSLVEACSGIRLLFNRWSHDNQPPWASLDKSILCLHIPCVDSRTEVSSSRRLLPCSPPKVQSAPQWWRAWLCRTISQCLVIHGYARCDSGSEEILFGQQASSSPVRLWGTFALWFADLPRWGLSFFEETDAWVWVSGGLLVGHPTLGFS